MKPRPMSYLQPRDAFIFVVIFLVLVSTESKFLVKTLPGFVGDLPFTLETGYIGVGESDEVRLFYYFTESEGNPKDDPLILWLTGGPGCSALTGLLFEIGPITINYESSTFEKAILKINPHSWTKAANIIFLDQPVGTGFSYTKTPESYITNDSLSALHTYDFLKKWLVDHPKFLNNTLYVAGDSYAGIWVPIIVQEIYNGNEAEEEPKINIEGYVLGNPVSDSSHYNEQIPFAHQMALLSDKIYQSVKESCHGEYWNVDPNNTRCVHDLEVVKECLETIFTPNILEPSCYKEPQLHIQTQWCRDGYYLYSSTWANSKDVREALHINEEFNDIEWVRCNKTIYPPVGEKSISYTLNVASVVGYHRGLSDKNCRALVYSGDHDLLVPYFSTLNWIESLNLLVENDWRPWFVNEQVGGYTMKFSKNDYSLTYATVKGGGHTAPEYKPKECLNMFMRWLANNSLEEVAEREELKLHTSSTNLENI